MELSSFSYGIILTLLVMLIISCSGSEGFTGSNGLKINNAQMITLMLFNYAYLGNVLRSSSNANGTVPDANTIMMKDKINKARAAMIALGKKLNVKGTMLEVALSGSSQDPTIGVSTATSYLSSRVVLFGVVAPINMYIPELINAQSLYLNIADLLMNRVIDVNDITDAGIKIEDMNVSDISLAQLLS